MMIYRVEWYHSKELAKGKGKLTKPEYGFVFTVLCRNSSDALRCLEFYFRHEFSYKNKHELTLDDGEISLKRVVVDSRNFTVHYLLMDDMREPIYLSDMSSNLLRSHLIFGTPNRYV